MAQVTIYAANVDVVSTFQSYMDGSRTPTQSGYTTPTTGTGTAYFDTSPIPAGASGISGTLYYSAGGSNFGGTARVNGAVSGHAVTNVSNAALTFKSNTGGSFPPYVYGEKKYYYKTGTCTFSSMYIVVNYTPPTAPSITGVYVNGSTAAQYKSGSEGVTISWGASNGTNNAITSYSLFYSDNDGAWTYFANTTAGSYGSSAHPNPGVKRRFAVIAVAPYGNSAMMAGPYVYTYSSASVSGVLINGSASTAYAGAGGVLTLSWSAANGSYNSITAYNVYYSDNGGGWVPLGQTTAGTYVVSAHPTAGSNIRFAIIALAPYGNSPTTAGPYVYSYSAVTAPTAVSISPTSIYTNSANPSLSWSGAGNGTGVSVSTYHIYQNEVHIGTQATSPFSVPTPTTAGTYNYTVRAIGSVGGYNSGESPAATLTTINPSSPFSLSSTGSDMNGVNTVTCTISPVDSSYTHTVTWKINGATKVDKYNAGASSENITHDFELLEDYCADLTDAKSMAAGGSCTIETKIGTNVVSETKTFAISVPDSIKPTALATLTSIYKIGEEYFYLYNINGCKVTGSGAEIYGSPIVKYQFELLFGTTSLETSSDSATNTWTTLSSSYVGIHTIKTTVTDARGQKGTRSDTFTVKNYNNPSLAPSYYRVSLVDGNWIKDDDGETLRVNPVVAPYIVKNGSDVVINNITNVTIRYKEKSSSTWSGATTILNNTANIIYQNLLAISTSYDLEITATDTFNLSITNNYTLSSAQRMFDFRNDRAAFGKPAGATKTFMLPDDWTTNVNADKLDGLHASELVASLNYDGTNMNNNKKTGFSRGYNMTNAAVTGISSFETIVYSADWITQIQHTIGATPEMYIRSWHSGTTWGSWYNIMHSGNILNKVYPVGAIYMSVVSTSPATLFGGTWAALGARFLIGVGTGYANGATGGAATHTHTTPNHTHTTPAVALTAANLPKQTGEIWLHGGESGSMLWHHDGVFSGSQSIGQYKPQTGGVTAGAASLWKIIFNSGGNTAHGHGATGNAKPTTNSASSLPPYLAVYMWKRTA